MAWGKTKCLRALIMSNLIFSSADVVIHILEYCSQQILQYVGVFQNDCKWGQVLGYLVFPRSPFADPFDKVSSNSSTGIEPATSRDTKICATKTKSWQRNNSLTCNQNRCVQNQNIFYLTNLLYRLIIISLYRLKCAKRYKIMIVLNVLNKLQKCFRYDTFTLILNCKVSKLSF